MVAPLETPKLAMSRAISLHLHLRSLAASTGGLIHLGRVGVELSRGGHVPCPTTSLNIVTTVITECSDSVVTITPDPAISFTMDTVSGTHDRLIISHYGEAVVCILLLLLVARVSA
jgi:hypothetical protein